MTENEVTIFAERVNHALEQLENCQTLESFYFEWAKFYPLSNAMILQCENPMILWQVKRLHSSALNMLEKFGG
jgi:hypothetical protein